MKFTLFIPSLGRPNVLAVNPLLEHAIVLLAEEQLPEYEAAFHVVGRRPKDIVLGNGFGVAKARNRIMEQWADEDFIAMVDDDTFGIMRLMRYVPDKVTDPEHMLDVLANTGRLALDCGSTVFGYALTPRPMERQAYKPFSFRGRLDEAACGITDRTFRFDESLKVSTDIDATFESIRRSRLCLVDNRYSWLHERWSRGGLSADRTAEVTRGAIRYLQAKWGKGMVELKPGKGSKSGMSLRVRLR